ncbi:VOC family protein [Marinicella gelatinilytica]|uniref:VOC family protein n=1 Tax=Marinicella gelatinilytica TaxID=2996017 RepID=UPI002260FB29|nr:VOC family protein [Marinicella gelatinilytica]MCX7543797.1 VOC family protein [Marinicella gelatinilytica]
MNKPFNAVVWFEIYVQDMTRAVQFYQNLFNIKMEALDSPTDDDMWSFPGNMENTGANGALVKMKGVDSGGGGTLVYFSCDDCAVEESRVETNGGQVIKSKFSIGEFGYISLISDTEGNMVGLHSMH